MPRPSTRVAVACAAAALIVVSTAGAASAEPSPVTCNPAVADGRMTSPGFWNGIGAEALLSGAWTCESDPTSGVSYTFAGTLTDYILENGVYRAFRSYHFTGTGGPGTSAFTPVFQARYAPRGTGVNTWHYVRFTATTSLGHAADVTSQLFYVAGALQ